MFCYLKDDSQERSLELWYRTSDMLYVCGGYHSMCRCGKWTEQYPNSASNKSENSTCNPYLKVSTFVLLTEHSTCKQYLKVSTHGTLNMQPIPQGEYSRNTQHATNTSRWVLLIENSTYSQYLEVSTSDRTLNMQPILKVRWGEFGCLTSHLTIFQSYMWRHIDVQADWRRSWTYGRAPNAIDISYGSFNVPVQAPTRVASVRRPRTLSVSVSVSVGILKISSLLSKCLSGWVSALSDLVTMGC